MFLAVALAAAALFALLARGSGATNAADRVPAEVTTVTPEVGAAGASRPGSEVMTAVHEAVRPKLTEAEVGPAEVAQP